MKNFHRKDDFKEWFALPGCLALSLVVSNCLDSGVTQAARVSYPLSGVPLHRRVQPSISLSMHCTTLCNPVHHYIISTAPRSATLHITLYSLARHSGIFRSTAQCSRCQLKVA